MLNVDRDPFSKDVASATWSSSPDVSTHFSGLSNEEGFFLPMFMRLLNFQPASNFFFTVEKRSVFFL